MRCKLEESLKAEESLRIEECGRANNAETELVKIKSNPNIGKLEVQDWPETPDY